MTIQKKRKLRIQGFTWGIANHLGETSELEQIEKLLSEENRTVEVLEKQADFVKGGLIKIKQHYVESNARDFDGTFSFRELYLYYSYIEQIVQSHVSLSEFLYKRYE